MSKAFIKDSAADDFSAGADDEHLRPSAPAKDRNYITPQGFKRLQAEFLLLKHKERPEVCAVVSWAAENGDRSENADYIYGKKRLREIDRRMRFLMMRLDQAEIIDPLSVVQTDRVLFGATVTLRDEQDRLQRYSIVGADETDPSLGRISWLSPLGSALLKSGVGDFVTFRSPGGEREIEIVKIEYLALS